MNGLVDERGRSLVTIALRPAQDGSETSYSAWGETALAHWLTHHTRIAIDTQANFEYVQNMVVRPLTDAAPAYDAFVEECFPDAAMTLPAAFFDAVGDEARFEANLAAMMQSCAAFIDFTRIDIIPTSQFVFAGQGQGSQR